MMMQVQMSGCVSSVEWVTDMGEEDCRDAGMCEDGEIWMCLAQGVTTLLCVLISSRSCCT